MERFTVKTTFFFDVNVYFEVIRKGSQNLQKILGVHIYKSKDIQFQEVADWTKEITHILRGFWCVGNVILKAKSR